MRNPALARTQAAEHLNRARTALPISGRARPSKGLRYLFRPVRVITPGCATYFGSSSCNPARRLRQENLQPFTGYRQETILAAPLLVRTAPRAAPGRTARAVVGGVCQGVGKRTSPRSRQIKS